MPSPALSRARPALGLAITVLLLAGCGSNTAPGIGAERPDQIVAAARSAAAGAATVHVAGSIGGPKKPISLDMELVRGKGASGRIATGGFRVDLVGVERAFYVKGNDAFYEHVAGPAAARLLHGKWLKAPANSGNFGALARLTDLGSLLEEALDSHGPLARAGTATVEGKQALAIRDTSSGGTLYVTASGTPYPLELAGTAGGSSRLFFDRWNQPVTLTPPAKAFNIIQLQDGP